eukprot:SAG31_NODE_27651_length_422_cov_1.167183_2_plen_75_part_01
MSCPKFHSLSNIAHPEVLRFSRRCCPEFEPETTHLLGELVRFLVARPRAALLHRHVEAPVGRPPRVGGLPLRRRA